MDLQPVGMTSSKGAVSATNQDLFSKVDTQTLDFIIDGLITIHRLPIDLPNTVLEIRTRQLLGQPTRQFNGRELKAYNLVDKELLDAAASDLIYVLSQPNPLTALTEDTPGRKGVFHEASIAFHQNQLRRELSGS